MTPEIQEFVRSLKLRGRVLEVGSLDVNGNVRKCLGRGSYVGVDMRPGPNVDRVANGHALPFPNNHFDVVLCLETLEHDEAFWLTLVELHRVLKKGGRLVITVPSIGFPPHDHPLDYYRFTIAGATQFFRGMKKVNVRACGDYAWTPQGVILLNGYATILGHATK